MQINFETLKSILFGLKSFKSLSPEEQKSLLEDYSNADEVVLYQAIQELKTVRQKELEEERRQEQEAQKLAQEMADLIREIKVEKIKAQQQEEQAEKETKANEILNKLNSQTTAPVIKNTKLKILLIFVGISSILIITIIFLTK